MKHTLKFAMGLLAVLAVGCGGSGNGPSSVVVSGSTPRVECIVYVQTTNLMHPSEWTAAQLLNPQTPGLQADLINPTVFGLQDPTNIECGEQMVFQVVTYSPDGTRNILPNVTWSSSDSTNVYGSLATNTGEYIVGNTSTTSPQTVAGVYNGVTYSAIYDVKIDQVRLIGSMFAQGTNANQLAGSLLQFFNTSGALVDTVTVQSDGSFRASVPTVATTFTIVADAEPAAFYQSFNYLGLQYSAGQVTCLAPLPSGLTIGTTIMPGAVYVPPRVAGQPTPTSTGCSDQGGIAKHVTTPGKH